MLRPEMLKKTAAKATESYVAEGLEKRVTQKEVEIILSAYTDMIKEELSKDRSEKIPMINMGNFNVNHTKARDGQLNGVAWHKEAEDNIAFSIYKTAKKLD